MNNIIQFPTSRVKTSLADMVEKQLSSCAQQEKKAINKDAMRRSVIIVNSLKGIADGNTDDDFDDVFMKISSVVRSCPDGYVYDIVATVKCGWITLHDEDIDLMKDVFANASMSDIIAQTDGELKMTFSVNGIFY